MLGDCISEREPYLRFLLSVNTSSRALYKGCISLEMPNTPSTVHQRLRSISLQMHHEIASSPGRSSS